MRLGMGHPTSWLAGLTLIFGIGCQQNAAPTAKPVSDQSTAASPKGAEAFGGVAKTASGPVAESAMPAVSTVSIDVEARRPARKLSDYGLFTNLAEQIPATDVFPYQLNSESFVDHARQQSYVYLPPGGSATYQADNALLFPVGTVLIQNIRFDETESERLLETRLLIHMKRGWTAVPYLWNADGTDADRAVIGEKTELALASGHGHDGPFTYLTPNMNECKRCHVNEDVMYPIGVTAANLNRSIDVDGTPVNQLSHWQATGRLTGLPENANEIPRLPDWHDSASFSVERRARSWLDVNCSHCHNPHGAASTSGLDLTFQQDQPVRFGVFKPPVAAGRGSQGLKFSILPQKPDESFLVRRIDSTELGVMMPPIGRSTVHANGVELIRQWIAEMEVDEALAEAALNPMKAYKDAGDGRGDAAAGRTIFHKGQKCITCHRVGDTGGSVGPNLSDVGKRVKRDYLLESIVVPSAKIVKGFETQSLVLIDGRVVTGTVQSEDQEEVVIADAQRETKIRKDEIDDRFTSDVSTMPSLANLLSVDDVRNLIAYLETLTETPQP